MMSDYSANRKGCFYNGDLSARNLFDCVFWNVHLQASTSSLYLVKTDVMWSSSGGKKVKQPLVRANKRPRKSPFIICVFLW